MPHILRQQLYNTFGRALEATRCPHCTAEIPADETAAPKVEAGPAPAAIPAK